MTSIRPILAHGLLLVAALGLSACEQPDKSEPNATSKSKNNKKKAAKPRATGSAKSNTPAKASAAAQPSASPADGGWKIPATACVLMDRNQLATDGFAEGADKIWRCASKERGVGSGGIERNTLLYEASGKETAVEQLKLVLTVHEPKHEGNARGQLRVVGDAMVRRITGKSIPGECTKSIQRGDAGKWTLDDLAIEVVKGDGAKPTANQLAFIVRTK